MDHRSKDYLKSLPKAELHLHLEGSISAELLSQLSRKYETEHRHDSPFELSQKLFSYPDFKGFLETYKTVCQHLREPDDYLLLADHLAAYLKEQNILYAEVIFSPAIPDHFERDGRAVLEALLEHGRQLESNEGLRIRWILDCVRQFGPEAARRTAELAVEFREQGVVGLGLGGDELSLPMSDFEKVFSWAKANQLYIHVHAGETGGPEQVWDAVRVLGANRIGHGIQSARDARLMEYLREHAVGLDICLTSNLKTQAWSRISTNPFGLLFKRGVPVSINTDDPGLFETTLVEELSKAVSLFSLSQDDLHRLVLQGLRSAFLPNQERMALMRQFTNQIHQIGSPGAGETGGRKTEGARGPEGSGP